jgi:hypothetical protein
MQEFYLPSLSPQMTSFIGEEDVFFVSRILIIVSATFKEAANDDDFDMVILNDACKSKRRDFLFQN